MKAKITKVAVDDLRAKASAAAKTLYCWDTELPGFGVLSTKSGSASYFVEYRLGGRGAPNKRVTIGKHGHRTPEQARKLAKVELGRIADGVDVAQARKEKRQRLATGTFREVAEKFLTIEDRGNRYWRETRRLIEQEAYPKLGSRPLSTITRADISDVIDTARVRSHAVGRNAFAALRPLFAWAHERGILDANPMINMRGPEPLKSRDRVLTDEEIKAFWSAAERLGGVFAPLFKLLLLTGQRREEVAGLAWEEIDFDKASWMIPASRTKNGRPHFLDLSPQAVGILERLHQARLANRSLVFTTTGETSVSGFSKAKAALDKLMVAELGKPLTPWRIHDLRRTAASGMAGLGFAPQVIERVLNHVSGAQGGLVGVYQRHNYREERKAAITGWGAHLDRLVGAEVSNVVECRRIVAVGPNNCT